jgi:anti-anti-sigma factor
MKPEHEHLTGGGSTTEPAKSRGRRSTSSGSSRALLELVSVGVNPERECRTSASLNTGELVVRRERRADALILWLTGELDQATSALLERELDAEQAGRPMRLVIDLTGLKSIDPSGLDTLAQARQRACQNGQPLSIRQGPRVVQPLLELTSKRPAEFSVGVSSAVANNERYYFALAMARADVDHQRPKVVDPGASPTGSPDQAAAASGARPLSPERRSRRATPRVVGPTSTTTSVPASLRVTARSGSRPYGCGQLIELRHDREVTVIGVVLDQEDVVRGSHDPVSVGGSSVK